jgi:hypothetical protein
MKRYVQVLILLIFLGCTSESGTDLKIRDYQGPVCDSCPVLRISIPEADEKNALGKSINRALREEIIALLDFDQENTAGDIPSAMEAFKKGFQKLKQDFPDELTGWEASFEGIKSYEDQKFLTLKLKTYVFSGGAHGYSATRYLNFDKKTGTEISGPDLLKDPEGFAVYSEYLFRQQYDIPKEASINSSGFMFEEDRFTLPENIGLTAEGIVLHFNPYEVASYADGPLILTIPHEQALLYLK